MTERRGAGAVRPYLAGALRAAFDAWLADTVRRHSRVLEFREIRRGVQAVSALYVQRREGADLAARAIEGRGKRAALATFYAPLHFLTAHHLLAGLGPATPWWRAWADALAGCGVDEPREKLRVALPDWLARLDAAAGLDHRVLGARVLVGPLADAAP